MRLGHVSDAARARRPAAALGYLTPFLISDQIMLHPRARARLKTT